MNPSNVPPTPPSEADIRERAYYLWLDHGCPADRDQEMWFAAKALLHDRSSPPEHTIRKSLQAKLSDPAHRFHDQAHPHDARPDVAHSGAMQRIRARGSS